MLWTLKCCHKVEVDLSTIIFLGYHWIWSSGVRLYRFVVGYVRCRVHCVTIGNVLVCIVFRTCLIPPSGRWNLMTPSILTRRLVMSACSVLSFLVWADDLTSTTPFQPSRWCHHRTVFVVLSFRGAGWICSHYWDFFTGVCFCLKAFLLEFVCGMLELFTLHVTLLVLHCAVLSCCVFFLPFWSRFSI